MAMCTSSLFRPFQSMQMISAEFRHGTNIVSCMQSRYLRSGSCHLAAKLPVVHDNGFSCEWPEKHRFKMAKFLKVMEWIIKDNLSGSVKIFQPMEPPYEVVTRVHNCDYVDGFISGSIPPKEMRKTGFHWSEGLVRRCLLEVVLQQKNHMIRVFQINFSSEERQPAE
ncbi:hypothetical protein pdam_00021721 [Pocillopora damicornis]|uniref:Histone deacetylase n=1 Tax=Pocillopora damicornis TaxID=46731 RepID=A0A3M6TJE6_POCDA|nr:hypothetical protein pdam_00021721 [Pocillopora damicornis]